MVVQGMLWAHAGAVAQAAADHGAEVAALTGSSDSAGIAAAVDFAANAGTMANITATAANPGDSDFVQLTLTATYPTFLGNRTISATAVTTRERLPGR